MNHQVTIIDFNDSFTFNISNEIYKLGINVEVISYKQLKGYLKFLQPSMTKRNFKHVLVYGPGPGHPEEYKEIYPIIDCLLQEEQLFHLGICLGHQILWDVKRGIKTKKSRNPVHGQRLEIKIPSWGDFFPESSWNKKVYVQRYNSLALDISGDQKRDILRKNEDLSFFEGECFLGRFDRCLTYQFHPESVGTSFNEIFFSPIGEFLH